MAESAHMEKCAFDLESATIINQRRMEILDRLLVDLKPLELKSAVDTGCGIGIFSQHLAGLGMQVVAFDARSENIAEAKKRFPRLQFNTRDIEDPKVLELGSFDLALCFGLLYHLENPSRAIRNLHGLTKKVLIIESMIAPHKRPMGVLIAEGASETQSLCSVALVPSEAYLVDMLYRAGFPTVYRTTELPNHEDFKPTLLHHRRRTILVASKVRLESPLLRPISEQRVTLNTWHRRVWISPRMARLGWILVRFLRLSPREKLWALWTRLLPGVPLLTHLDFGSLWLAWNDALSKLIYTHVPFEKNEQEFVKRFLASGMTVFDVGAHHGIYTLLASRLVGQDGRVVAFEPSPREVKRLRWNLALNRCKNCMVEQVAVGRAYHDVEFHVCLGQRTGFNSLRPPDVQELTRTIKVHATTLDRYTTMHQIDHIDFLKTDTEGGDLDVLKGAAHILNSASPPIIMCEVQDRRARQWGYNAREILEYVENHGY